MRILIILALVLELSAWEFSTKHVKQLTNQQLEVLRTSYLIGNTKDLGIELATIAMIESRAGQVPDTNQNRICGVHQIDVLIISKTRLNSKGSAKKLCKAVEQSVSYSSHLAVQELNYWFSVSKTESQAVLRYNRGWKKNKHDAIFWGRYAKVKRVLQHAINTKLIVF